MVQLLVATSSMPAPRNLRIGGPVVAQIPQERKVLHEEGPTKFVYKQKAKRHHAVTHSRPLSDFADLVTPKHLGPDDDTTAQGYDLWWSSDPTEVTEPLRLEVHGQLPAWLKGSLVRVGPGQFEVGRQRLQHQMDGLAKLTRYAIDGSRVTFQTRMLRSDLFNRTKLAAPPSSPWALWTEPALLTMLPVVPTYTPCQRVRALMEEPATDNTNIFIWRTGKTIHACSDTSIATNAFDLDTLESRGHATVESDSPSHSTDTTTGAHRQHVINGSATIGWSGHIDMRQDKLSLSATVISVYRDEPIEADAAAAEATDVGATSAEEESTVARPAARRRRIGMVRV